MVTEDTDPDFPIPDQGNGADSWLASLCAERGLEIVGPSCHGLEAVDVIESMTLRNLELWAPAWHPLGGAALGCFKDLLAAMGGRLCHPNILPFYEGGVQEDRPCLLVPRFGGGTLRDRLRDGPIPVGEPVELSRPGCSTNAWTQPSNRSACNASRSNGRRVTILPKRSRLN
jgi:hypothetical protein